MTNVLNPLKWTDRQIAILRVLTEADGPLYGTEIAERANVGEKSVYTALDRLAAWRYIVEVNPPTRRAARTRRRYYTATDRGRTELAKRNGDVPRETTTRKKTMTTKTYVTLQPHSNTNPTSRHRVVDADKWQAYVNGDASYYPVESDHGDHDSAQAAADKLNGKGV